MLRKLINEVTETLQIMNCMCNLTKFIVSILVKDAVSKTLANLFMEHVVL